MLNMLNTEPNLYPLDPRFHNLSIRNLPLNRRQQLASYLNSEQILMSDSGYARDYRGLAQQLELPYSEISKLSNAIDPTSLLLQYHSVNKLSLMQLFRMIEIIGRYDILDDVCPGMVDDLDHLENQDQKNKNKVVEDDDKKNDVHSTKIGN